MKTEQAALSLYQLLGAPLFALIEAEKYAANATADFIREMGFEPPKAEPGKTEVNKEEFGNLRTITFKQQRRAADGSDATYKVEVPLLSILPIPALQIKEADLEFFVKIVGLDTESAGSTAKTQAGRGMNLPGKSPLVPLPAPPPDMKAMLGRGHPNHALAPNSAFDMQVHINIKVAQADPPAGLSRLFNLMEQSISSTREIRTEEENQAKGKAAK